MSRVSESATHGIVTQLLPVSSMKERMTPSPLGSGKLADTTAGFQTDTPGHDDIHHVTDGSTY